jgi:hypothetical protein
MAPMQNVLPPQQILQAAGKQSVESIKLSPNSSVLIADSTRPIIYKCVSDSLGAVSIEMFDVTAHKDEEVIEKENLSAIVNDLRMRIERLENEQSIIIRNRTESGNAESHANEAATPNDEVVQQSQGNG